jgi:hypothetical protein
MAWPASARALPVVIVLVTSVALVAGLVWASRRLLGLPTS